MTLYDYLELMPEGEELTVWDVDYDMEVYFYGGKPGDTWSESLLELSKLLTIKEIRTGGVIVNLSYVIEMNIDEVRGADLFHDCSIDQVMESIESILAGNVSEAWMQEFVSALK